MPRIIIKLDDKYFEWSTVVEAPVTLGLTLEEFIRYYQDEYGRMGLEGLDRRLERVEKYGTSSMVDVTVFETIHCNRAGHNEKHLDKDEILEHYKYGGC